MTFLTNRVARLLFAIPFGIFGIVQLMNADSVVGMVPEFIPGGIVWVYLTGLALLAASFAIVSQRQVRLASLLLAVMLLVFVFTVHLPAVLDGDPNAMPNLLKDTSLAGGALLLAGIYWDWDEPLMEESL
ncbi:MAG: DoxX family protein [Balneolaceae bacterium]|nr:DoxX family protein [Balneolaceae bacterium]